MRAIGLLLASLPVLAAEVASPAFGFLADGRVVLSTATAGAVVRYTFEEKDPDKSAGMYLAPVTVPAGKTIRARAFSADGSEQSMLLVVAGRGMPSTLMEVTQNRDWKNYDWVKRHERILRVMRERPPELVFLGDSITHFFGGEPADARLRGPEVWEKYYGSRQAINIGYGWDRTENVLWRLRHGEIDGIAPKAVVVMIGTNNAGINTAEEIAAGITAICEELHLRLPAAKILLLGIFPRGAKPDAMREKLKAVNEKIAALDGKGGVSYLDIGDVFLEKDGTISPFIMNDYLHPTSAGYERWASAMEPMLKRLLGE
ncbi:MAG: chitobiase/beta-hexosaminidase C-terminal domain-containing protein [Acidobacteria bacterium]|nr:chitobiase/beta-hexosaminidase C-terminal domain-containing protein [Acidobacteriota bacterium]